MHLVSALAAGVQGAASGTVNIYTHGLGSVPTLYSDSIGTAMAGSSGMALDSNGGMVVYVDRSVDVSVYDQSNVLVRAWTEVVGAENVQVESQSFTGINPATLASAAGQPVDLGTVLDLWKTSAGSIDWNVLIGTTKTSIQNALGGFAGLFFSVKNPAYGGGATGNGIADDKAAIQAAIDAAATLGGVVFFPPGTYRCASGLILKANVDLWGCGPNASIIQRDQAADWLFAVNASTYQVTVQGLRLYDAQVTTFAVVEFAANCNVRFVDCEIGGANSRAVGLVAGPSTATARFENCNLTCGAAAASSAVVTGTVHATRTTFTAGAGLSQTGVILQANTVHADRCSFAPGAGTTGTYYSIAAITTYLSGSVRSCSFTTSTPPINVGTFASSTLVESDNKVPSMVDVIVGTSAGLVNGFQRKTEAFSAQNWNMTAPLTLDLYKYSVVTVDINNAAQISVLDATAVGHPGMRCTLRLANVSAGAITSLTYGAGIRLVGLSVSTPAKDKALVIPLVALVQGGALVWVEESGAYTPQVYP